MSKAANQGEPSMTEAKRLAAMHPINCPMCRSTLKVLQRQPEQMFCVCCGVSVTVPVNAWQKYERLEPYRG